MIHLGFASYDIVCETWNDGDDHSDHVGDVDCVDCLKQRYDYLMTRANIVQTRLTSV